LRDGEAVVVVVVVGSALDNMLGAIHPTSDLTETDDGGVVEEEEEDLVDLDLGLFLEEEEEEEEEDEWESLSSPPDASSCCGSCSRSSSRLASSSWCLARLWAEEEGAVGGEARVR